MDIGASAFSVATLPVWVIKGIGSLAAANFLALGVFAVLATSDVMTIKETFEPKKSPWNPTYWLRKVFRGSGRLGGNQRLN